MKNKIITSIKEFNIKFGNVIEKDKDSDTKEIEDLKKLIKNSTGIVKVNYEEQLADLEKDFKSKYGKDGYNYEPNTLDDLNKNMKSYFGIVKEGFDRSAVLFNYQDIKTAFFAGEESVENAYKEGGEFTDFTTWFNEMFKKKIK